MHWVPTCWCSLEPKPNVSHLQCVGGSTDTRHVPAEIGSYSKYKKLAPDDAAVKPNAKHGKALNACLTLRSMGRMLVFSLSDCIVGPQRRCWCLCLNMRHFGGYTGCRWCWWPKHSHACLDAWLQCSAIFVPFLSS